MRYIDLIIVHCTAARQGSGQTTNQVRSLHKRWGWSDIGYHFVVEDDGVIGHGRTIDRAGAHAKGFNKNSIGIAYTGGLGADGKGISGPNFVQQAAMRRLIDSLRTILPNPVGVIGHRDTGAKKDCPCFDVGEWMRTGEAIASRNLA